MDSLTMFNNNAQHFKQSQTALTVLFVVLELNFAAFLEERGRQQFKLSKNATWRLRRTPLPLGKLISGVSPRPMMKTLFKRVVNMLPEAS